MGAATKRALALLLTAVLAVSVATQTAPAKAPHAKTSEAKPSAITKTNILTTKPEIGSKKILVLLPIAAPSHHHVISALTNELLERGHYLTIVSSRPQKKKHPRLREISIKDPFAEMFSSLNKEWFTKQQDSISKVLMMYGIGELLTKAIFESPKALELKNENFDLVLTETYFFQEPLLGFAHHFNCPAVNINPFGYSNQLNEFTGGAINPAYVPNVFGDAKKPETFLDRLSNTVITAFSMLTYHLFYYPKMNTLLHEAFPNAPPLYDLMTNVSLTLINNNMALMHPIPLSPSVVEVGGMHIQPGKPLPADLKKWIDESQHGIVYFSLGSNLQADKLPEEKRQILFESFAKLKQRVLVKWDGDAPADRPANCRFEQWVPQQEVLVHPKLKVFITHGGLLSTQESVYFGAAIIGMPIFGDQEMNMQMAEQQGFAKMVSFYELSTNVLDDALNEVINNPKYREQSKKLSVRFRSDPLTSLEKAVYHTELLMKLGDLKHLRPSSVYLTWYQYLLLDVIAVLAVGLYLTWRIIRCICSLCLGCCCKSSKTKKD